MDDSNKEGASLVLEAFLPCSDSIEQFHTLSTHPHAGVLRYCDAAMYYLKNRGKVPEFEITWPPEKRDAAIGAYLNTLKGSLGD